MHEAISQYWGEWSSVDVFHGDFSRKFFFITDWKFQLEFYGLLFGSLLGSKNVFVYVYKYIYSNTFVLKFAKTL